MHRFGRRGGEEEGLTSRVMVYVKMMNESARGTTSSSASLLFLIIAIIRIPSGGSVVERGPGNERRSFGCLVVFWCQ